ncbi:MAG: L-aspartate oxidase [Gammaproteobacteria bacterium HGW-Gammaproteobacteria-8]|nr:MAG: L-aspartate oxidase [Gammaproteobacteria bacterium HGW-Gammaproteobacteria-8]
MREPPVVIVGSGIAGAWAALQLAPLPVIVLAGRHAGGESSSAWAQGGIAAALGADDTPELHAADTLAAGAGLVDEAVARAMTEAAPDQVRALEAIGVAFEHDADGGWQLSLEAAHGRARVARVGGDQAGAAIVQALVAALGRAAHVELREGWFGAGLDTQDGVCRGVIARDPGGKIRHIEARAMVLATGGIGGLYALTTNPPGNRGQALAWAARAGCRIQDPEFVQFHPTAIDVGRNPAPLATEALRGEGALLVDQKGNRFMPELHPDAELAPRDVVARAVFAQLQAGRGAFLDARDAVGIEFPTRFPAVFHACMAFGIDPRHQPIPVAPAVHYHMGGIKVGLDGRTEVERLYAIGEVACTGLHGANRLASNSLAEALVMAARAAASIRAESAAAARTAQPQPEAHPQMAGDALATLRRAMSTHAGVIRDAAGLRALLDELQRLEQHHGERDALLVARFIASAALRREESRGAHWRADFPEPEAAARHSTLGLSDL